MKAVIFARVSSAEQAAEGGSILAQRKACERLAQREGMTIVGCVVAPGESGYKERRPSLGELRETVTRTGATVVLVLKANRLARSWTVAGEIVRSSRVRVSRSDRSWRTRSIRGPGWGTRNWARRSLAGNARARRRRC